MIGLLSRSTQKTLQYNDSILVESARGFFMTNSNPSSSKQSPAAGLGMHVVLDLVTVEGLERLEFDIVPDENADFKLGFLGAGTPLARAIQGRRAGQTVPYQVGGGKEVHLISVAPASKAPSKEIAARRQETLRKAIDRADRTNAMIFASSFSGKWGDYDPTGFTEEEDEEEEEEL